MNEPLDYELLPTNVVVFRRDAGGLRLVHGDLDRDEAAVPIFLRDDDDDDDE